MGGLYARFNGGVDGMLSGFAGSLDEWGLCERWRVTGRTLVRLQQLLSVRKPSPVPFIGAVWVNTGSGTFIGLV